MRRALLFALTADFSGIWDEIFVPSDIDTSTLLGMTKPNRPKEFERFGIVLRRVLADTTAKRNWNAGSNSALGAGDEVGVTAPGFGPGKPEAVEPCSGDDGKETAVARQHYTRCHRRRLERWCNPLKQKGAEAVEGLTASAATPAPPGILDEGSSMPVRGGREVASGLAGVHMPSLADRDIRSWGSLAAVCLLRAVPRETIAATRSLFVRRTR